MIPPLRRLVGSVVLVVTLTLYCLFAMAVGDVIVASKPWWVQILYFTVAGLLWVPPAGLLIRWMYRPATPGRRG